MCWLTHSPSWTGARLKPLSHPGNCAALAISSWFLSTHYHLPVANIVLGVHFSCTFSNPSNLFRRAWKMPWSVILMSEVHCTQFQTKHSHSDNFLHSQGDLFCLNFFNFLLLEQSIWPKWSWWNLRHPLLLRWQLFSSSISGGRDLELLMACYTCSFLAGQPVDQILLWSNIFTLRL